MVVNMNIPVDSALAVIIDYAKKVLHKLNLRCPNLRFYPMDKQREDLYCGLTVDKNKILRNFHQDPIQRLDLQRKVFFYHNCPLT